MLMVRAPVVALMARPAVEENVPPVVPLKLTLAIPEPEQ